MSDDHAGLSITIPARPKNVAVVRHAVAGLAEQLGMEEPGIGDLKTIVTEACMNVVVHAYDEDAGPLEVEAFPDGRELTVVVRDFGGGIRPHPDLDRPSLRIGLTLIAALSSSFEISGGLDRGTRITMRLPLAANGDGKPPVEAGGDVSGAADLKIAGRELIAPVLARTVGALAARHRIAVDRLSDAYLITDALAAEAADAFPDGQTCFSVTDDEAGIDLRVGPVPPGGGTALREGLAIPAVGGSLESLVDQVRVEKNERGEYLLVRFAAFEQQL
ncbi:MAG TPA: ATP-binding protein [Solirubrobacterales bacterium]|nr:ATP-binding protein [Solirubrobacterales bacterium]